MKLSTEQSRVLLDLLGMTDATHEPIRSYDGRRPGVLWELRQRYRAAGIQWSSDELSTAGRKSAQRALEFLAGAGLVDVTRNVGRTAAVKLTDHGEAVARRLGGGVTSIEFAAERMKRLADLAGQPGTALNGYVPEPMLCGTRWGDGNEAALWEVQADLFPALGRGWVEATTSVRGHCWYRLTEAGARAEIPDFGGLPEPPADGVDDYIQAVRAARARIGELAPTRPGELGFLPCPVSMPVIGEGER